MKNIILEENIRQLFIDFDQGQDINFKIFTIYRFDVFLVQPKIVNTNQILKLKYYLFSAENSDERAIACVYLVGKTYFLKRTWRSTFMDEELLTYLTLELISLMTNKRISHIETMGKF